MKKSEQILKDGAAIRQTFTPEPNSAPTRAYKYWVESSQHGLYPENENFCHFWRVVLIWAPVWWVLNHTILSAPVERAVNKINIPPIPAKAKKVILTSLLVAWCALMAFLLVVAIVQEPVVLLVLLGVGLFVAAFFGILVWIGGITEEKRIKRRATEREEFQKALDAWLYENGPSPWAKPEATVEKKPSRFKKLLAAFREYSLVVVNAVRVKKWRICPFVEVPVDTDRSML